MVGAHEVTVRTEVSTTVRVVEPRGAGALAVLMLPLLLEMPVERIRGMVEAESVEELAAASETPVEKMRGTVEPEAEIALLGLETASGVRGRTELGAELLALLLMTLLLLLLTISVVF